MRVYARNAITNFLSRQQVLLLPVSLHHRLWIQHPTNRVIHTSDGRQLTFIMQRGTRQEFAWSNPPLNTMSQFLPKQFDEKTKKSHSILIHLNYSSQIGSHHHVNLRLNSTSICDCLVQEKDATFVCNVALIKDYFYSTSLKSKIKIKIYICICSISHLVLLSNQSLGNLKKEKRW
jgi:hypothetical protein